MGNGDATGNGDGMGNGDAPSLAVLRGERLAVLRGEPIVRNVDR